ncbi:MAG: ligand-binding protein SH3 [Spirochaetaceae bacterium]|nr:MAG: ligand-binding protein SH3 [Spirochaetaceae bacterium]
MDPLIAFFFCTVVNFLVIPFAFFFLETIHKFMLRFKLYKSFSDKILERARNKVKKVVTKYGYFGLAIFVAIPLPLTGAYTGVLGAWMLGMDKVKSMIAIAAGVLTAGALVFLAMYLVSMGYDWASIFFQVQK